jgi:hypothetical protein
MKCLMQFRRWPVWVGLLILPMLACGPLSQPQVTPTPTKTPRPLVTLAQLDTATATPAIISTPVPIESVPTDTPLPPPTDTPAPEQPTPEPATPTPEPLPTDPPPPPPPTNTPVPPPPPVVDTPVPAAPAPANTPVPAPAANSVPVVIIQLPDGDTYSLNDNVRIIVIVQDPDGVKEFEWGVFAQNGSPTGLGDRKGCGNLAECRLEDEFETKLTGQFFIGVDAVDALGNDIRQVVQLYVG